MPFRWACRRDGRPGQGLPTRSTDGTDAYEGTLAASGTEIEDVDDLASDGLDTLEELGRDDGTLVVLTADHGEAIDEHRVFCNHWIR